MATSRDFVAIDWRAGKDKCFFFFKDTNTYSRFDLGDNRVPEGYPKPIKYSNWHDFHAHARNLRFGFACTVFDGRNLDKDILWLFYYDASTPMVCKYDQDTDQVIKNYRVEDTDWKDLLPFFDHIVAGTWWQTSVEYPFKFRFLTNDGRSIWINHSTHLARGSKPPRVRAEPLTNSTWPGLVPYKDRIITAAQNNRSFGDSYLYIFLTNNEYIAYNIHENKIEYGPKEVNDGTWPGLVLPSRSEISDTGPGAEISDTEFNFGNSHDER
ncbi:hypothetical protein PS862_02139 [Pseudomonas fluorescens]|uniref:Uncharacterized protein n=1 Tax=Pseudomonas fluorescens TaxID=294 RepID=A0A5E6XX40_PSEFL|nr:hypothetical protein [Pseudomonas fluorescens]VVN45596.1 hypothetical protein PS639_05717 [Pseudomonas fluorescens]VVO86997.1 hypothetical protein PS862_02139 [Pseudomonas fluorescens]